MVVLFTCFLTVLSTSFIYAARKMALKFEKVDQILDDADTEEEFAEAVKQYKQAQKEPTGQPG